MFFNLFLIFLVRSGRGAVGVPPYELRQNVRMKMMQSYDNDLVAAQVQVQVAVVMS